MNEINVGLIVGALDSLGVALAEHGHEWTDGERAIYEEAVKTLWNEFENVRGERRQKKPSVEGSASTVEASVTATPSESEDLCRRLHGESQWRSKETASKFVEGEKCPRCQGTGIIGRIAHGDQPICQGCGARVDEGDEHCPQCEQQMAHERYIDDSNKDHASENE